MRTERNIPDMSKDAFQSRAKKKTMLSIWRGHMNGLISSYVENSDKTLKSIQRSTFVTNKHKLEEGHLDYEISCRERYS